MANGKGLLSSQVRICTVMIACDGKTLARQNVECCGACRDTLDRRARGAKPLRGERLMQYEAERRAAAGGAR